MSVSVSQIGTGRLLDRSIDQSQFPGQFLDQSICVCRCLYKEQPTPTRSHFCRKILRLVDLFSISVHFIPSTSRASIHACPRGRDTSFISSRSHREDCLADSRTVTRSLDRTPAHVEHRTIESTQENSRCWASEKSRPRKCARNVERHDEEGRESGDGKEDDAPTDRPGFLKRS